MMMSILRRLLWEVLPIDWATDWTEARHGINEVVIVNEEDYNQEEEEGYVRVGDYYQCFVLLKHRQKH